MALPENSLADYLAITNGSGYVELSDWSAVTVSGEDRHTFLHNMCTNDIRRLATGACCEAFCTEVKGKIVAHVFVMAAEDCLHLVTLPGQAQRLIDQLDRYIIREDVTLQNATDDTSIFFVGNASTELGITYPDMGQLPGSLVCCPRDEFDSAEEQLGQAGLAKCDINAWEALRIEAGLPLFGVDFDDTNLPQEVNRDALAINFNKGCYLGQETIARIDALGHVNQKVVLLQFAVDAVPAVGLELQHSDKVVGRVTSSCWSPQLNAPLAFAIIRRGANELGTELGSVRGPATVISPVVHASQS